MTFGLCKIPRQQRKIDASSIQRTLLGLGRDPIRESSFRTRRMGSSGTGTPRERGTLVDAALRAAAPRVGQSHVGASPIVDLVRAWALAVLPSVPVVNDVDLVFGEDLQPAANLVPGPIPWDIKIFQTWVDAKEAVSGGERSSLRCYASHASIQLRAVRVHIRNSTPARVDP